ncbi:FAS1 domain-containing protein [Halenospora varia]|nr:FAS1 domain-containing protein [Halenospora varia]
MRASLVLALALSFVGPSIQQSAPSFKEVIATQKNLTSFNETLTKYYPDLLTYIGAQTSSNPITVLAPSNAAFAKTTYYSVIGPAFSNKDVQAIRNIMTYHVVTGNHPSTALLPTFQYFPTWLSNSSWTNVTNGQRVGAVMQRGTEMIWTSGISNRSPVIAQDISFAGGTIHIVDSLLIPPTSFPMTAELFSGAAEPYQLTSFLGATNYGASQPNATGASLARYLNTTGDLTLFVPNNAAMESVRDAVTSLSSNSDAFDKLLKYHIVQGKGGPWHSTMFNESDNTLEPISGGSLTVTFSSNSYFVNGARLLTSDLLIDGGVMHVIDNVLSPDNIVKPNPSLATQVPALSTGANFNISAAPFTTWLPNTIDTRRPTATAGYTGNGAAGTTSYTGSSSAATGTKKSAGVRVAPVTSEKSSWVVITSLVGVLMMGLGAVVL